MGHRRWATVAHRTNVREEALAPEKPSELSRAPVVIKCQELANLLYADAVQVDRHAPHCDTIPRTQLWAAGVGGDAEERL